ncbi:hypothetical protein [Cytobacillus gottheilii]|uniref:Uncharacterized protein n=1 Tax=Cytobacillus gottheilii TaxID=859144 RepID=A0ABX8FIW4_9BACI|nr:hypothetical protein [Cytobacillus gottheilii]QVY63969.1 hypothetical protein J1899_22285 [Cytobacillus gottheilii]
MKKYSRLNLLSNAVLDNTGEIINRIFESKYARLEIEIPTSDLKRAQVFVNTVNELIEDEVDEYFTVDKLIVLLYRDFLRQVDQGMDLETLANAIRAKMAALENKTLKVKHYLALEEDMDLDSLKQRVKAQKKKRMSYSVVTFKVYKQSVLRGELLLHDLAELHPDLEMTVEDLIALRLRDVLKEIKKGDYNILANVVELLT